MSKVKAIGLVTILAVLFGACYLSGKNVFVDLPSLLFVAGLTVGSLLYKHGKNGVMLWSQGISVSEKADIAKTGSRSSLTAGVLGLFIGIVAFLANLGDLSAIGPFLALSLLSVIYGIVFHFIFFLPFKK